MLKIILHGDLEDFGKEWELDVHSPEEATRAIEANSPGFLSRLQSGKYTLLALPCDEEIVNEDQMEVISEDRYNLPISNKQRLHYLPIEEGNVETAIFVIASNLAIWGVPTYLAVAIAAVAVFGAITFALTTLSEMLAPTPPGMDMDEADPSYSFSGPVNTARQGGAVPVLYGGPLLIGSQVIGHSIVTEDISGSDGDGRLHLKSAAFAEVVDAISE